MKTTFKGLEHFHVPEMDRGRTFDDEPRPEEKLPALLIGVMDEEQKQWRAVRGLQQDHVAVWCFPDHFHARSNCWRGLARAGVVHWALLAVPILNLAYGNKTKSKFYTEWVEYGADLVVSCDPNDTLLVKCWPRICKAKRWDDPEFFTTQKRKEYIEELPAAKTFNSKGTKCASAKFFSINKAWRAQRSELPTKAFVFAHLCNDKGLVQHWEELFEADLFAPTRPTEVAASSGSAAASSSAAAPDGAPPPAPTSVTKAKEDAKQKYNQVLQRSQNGFHAVTRMICDTELVQNIDTAILFTTPADREHSKYAEGEHDIDTIKKYFLDMTNGEWLKPCCDMLKITHDVDQLQTIGFETRFSPEMKDRVKEDSPTVQQQDSLAQTCWSIVSHQLSERVITMANHLNSFPEFLGGLNGTDAESHAALCRWQQLWEAVAEASHQTIPEVKRLVQLNPLTTPIGKRTSDVARACAWAKTADTDMVGHVFFGGFGDTLMVERSNKDTRDMETRDAPRNSMSLWRSWDKDVTSQILERHGRPGVCVTAEIPNVEESTEPDSWFKFSEDDVKALDFDKIMSDSLMSADARGRRRVAVQNSLLLKLKELKRWDLARDAWRCAVVPLHHLLLHKPEGKWSEILYIIDVSEFGIVGWNVNRVGKNAVQLEDDNAKPVFRHDFAFDELWITPYTVISP